MPPTTTNPNRDTAGETAVRLWAVLAVSGLLLWLALLSGGAVDGALAQSNNSTNVSDVAPLYENESAAVDNQSWMEGHQDPTIVNVTHYLTRFATFVVGDAAAGQDAGVGPMLTGFILFGMAGGITSRSRTGAVGGSVLGVLAVAGVYVSGLAPVWLWAVVIFGLGAVASAVMIRLLR